MKAVINIDDATLDGKIIVDIGYRDADGKPFDIDTENPRELALAHHAAMTMVALYGQHLDHVDTMVELADG